MGKLEEHIKAKLEERSIEPTDTGWKRVASQLDPEPQSGFKWKWYAVAASLVGIAIVTSMFFQGPSTQEEQIKVVETESAKPPVDPVVEQRISPVEEALAETQDIEVPRVRDQRTAKEENDQLAAVVETPQLDLDIEQSQEGPGQEKLVDDGIIDAKIQEVLTQVTALEGNAIEITEAEIDSLLHAAQKSILLDQLVNDSGKVDAMALLGEVEAELDQSFRDQIFERLKSGYLKLRTAVADRNN
ncbi:MAG: hypothetical protein HRT65_06310 [Flavobacteriaceae bacterium]|nr:hypothetical protein [Flavobacteriaceae bacterium]